MVAEVVPVTVDAADVSSLLPPEGRLGGVQVVDVSTFDDFDADGEDALRIVLTLANPPGDTWPPLDVLEIESIIKRGLVSGGEDRHVIIWLRSESEDDAPDEGPMTFPGR